MARNFVDTRDNGYRRLLENIATAKGKTMIRAGVFEGSERRPKSGETGEPLTNAEVAAVNEFGLGHTPERSFLRATVDQKQDEIHDRLRRVGGGVFKGREEIAHESALFGEWFVGEMKTRIRDGIDPPDAPETIAHKGSSTPLIDSSQLLGSLTYDVKQGVR